MRYLIIVLLIVSCGKDPVKSSTVKEKGLSPVVLTPESTSEEPVQEMVEIECKFQRACETVCMNIEIACYNLYGGQNVTYQQLLQNPTWEASQNQCRYDAQICYNKKIQVTKEEYDWIMSH